MTRRFAAALGALGEALRTFRPDWARGLFAKACAIDPGSARRWARLAQAEAEASDWPAAADSYGRAAALAPENGDIHHRHGRALTRARRPLAAVEAYETACRLRPRNNKWRLALALALGRSGRSRESLSLLRSLREDSEDDPALQARLADALARFRDWSSVRDCWAAVEARSPSAPARRNHHTASRKAAALGRMDAEFRAGTEDGSGDPFRYHMVLGHRYRKAKLTAAAMDAYGSALEADDGRADWYPGTPAPVDRTTSQALSFAPVGVLPGVQRPRPRPSWVDDALSLNLALCFDEAREVLARGRAAHGRMTTWQKTYVEFLDGVIRGNAEWLRQAGFAQGHRPFADGFWPVGAWKAARRRRKLSVSGMVFQPCDNVYLFVNNAIARAINTRPDHSDRLRTGTPFFFGLGLSTIQALPRFSRLSVGLSGGVLLNTDDWKEEAEFLCPNGDGGLIRGLRDGSNIITKHGQLTPALTHAKDWQQDVLEAYQIFRAYFRERFGYELFVVYGVLLGALRSGEFISTDDDFDVAYFSRATSAAAVLAELIGMIEQITADGYKIKINRKRRMFKVLVNGVWLDCFAGWKEGDRVWMPQTTSVVSDESLFLPLAEIDFKGTRIAIPNKSEAFLEAVYGPDWLIPDPGYMNPIRPPEIMEHLASTYLSPRQVRRFRALGVID